MFERMWRNWNPYVLLIGMQKGIPHWKFLKMLNVEVPYNPGILLLGVQTRKKL